MENEKYVAQKKYHAKNRQTLTLSFMKSTEQELLDYLETVPNKAGYIKNLIRDDIINKTESTDISSSLNKVKEIVRSYYNYENGDDFSFYAAGCMEELVDLLQIRGT